MDSRTQSGLSLEEEKAAVEGERVLSGWKRLALAEVFAELLDLFLVGAARLGTLGLGGGLFASGALDGFALFFVLDGFGVWHDEILLKKIFCGSGRLQAYEPGKLLW